MNFTRRSGILLHPTALPGRFGRGELGPEALRFLDGLASAGQRVWQILPLGPPGYGGSPYAAASAFAGDPGLISLEWLAEEGWVEASALEGAPAFAEGVVSEEVDGWRRGVLEGAFAAFEATASEGDRAALAAFVDAQSYWLDDWCVFAALKDREGGRPFWEWPQALFRARPGAVRAARAELSREVAREAWYQFQFQRHWERVRAHAAGLGVEVLGDAPIFVARDSADVWCRPELFELDAQGNSTVVAGVPPDAFSELGQLWGNPLYDWAIHARTGYAWWIERVRRAVELADAVRIDHFRGFASYYQIPAGAPDARTGRWVPGPRMQLFGALSEALGELPLVAEDLGLVTPDVTELLARSGFPGMKILQFAFDGDPKNPFLPEQHEERSVAYTGTHDNQTTAGWWAEQGDAVRGRVRQRIGGESPVWGLIELAWSSRAYLAIAPAQDLLELGDEARFNEPGTQEGNWRWRLVPGQLDAGVWERLGALTRRHGRAPSA